MPRREPRRVTRRRVLVVCGGTRTEPDYFHGIRRLLRRPDVTLSIKAVSKSPDQLVDHAVTLMSHRRDQFDELWCVVDVDEFDLDRAARSAKAAGVRLAVSNPCFEVWLLLHFDDGGPHLSGSAEAIRRLRRHLPAYDKARLQFDDYGPGVAEAVRRARKLDDGTAVGANPSSGVWRLVEQIARTT